MLLDEGGVLGSVDLLTIDAYAFVTEKDFGLRVHPVEGIGSRINGRGHGGLIELQV